jgi:hypothetical protein
VRNPPTFKKSFFLASPQPLSQTGEGNNKNMIKLCPQLKQNLETIKTLKSELDLELPKIEKLFKDLKTGQKGKEHKTERKDLMNKIKSLKAEINLELAEIEKIVYEFPPKKIEVGKKFNLRVRYRGLEEMINAIKFNYKSDDDYVYSGKFPIKKELMNQSVMLKAKIFYFEEGATEEEAIKEINKNGFRPATFAELLALAEIWEFEGRMGIKALGDAYKTQSDGAIFVSAPYFEVNNKKVTDLHIGYISASERSPSYFRCLAIRKENK